MFRAARITALLAAALAVSVATASAATKLAWKWNEGEKIEFTSRMDMKMAMTIMGMQIKMPQLQVFDTTWNVTQVGSDGSADVTVTVDRMQMSTEVPGIGKIEYDSASDAKPVGVAAQAAQVIDAIVGQPVNVRVSASGEVLSTELPQEMVDTLTSAAASAMGGMLSESTLQQLYKQTVLELPEGDIETGHTWEDSFEVPFPNVGKQTTVSTFTYAGTETRDGKSVEKIDVVQNQTIEAEPGSAMKIDVKEQDTKGTIYFDRAAGRLVGMEMTSKVTMEMSAMGQKFTMQMDITSSTLPGRAPEGDEPSSNKSKGSAPKGSKK
jgi:hypothetical protein